MKVLVTGAAGFIGFYAVKRFVDEGYEVVGLDNINDYYDVQLKYDRLKESGIGSTEIKDKLLVLSNKWERYRFIKLDIQDDEGIEYLFKTEKFDIVVHFAAQAGVRYSLENPKSYIASNVVGFHNLMEACRAHAIKKFIYASSSSVYGMSKNPMLSVTDDAVRPVSLYAATKKSNELIAHAYSHLYQITTIGLRFFTVYGPWGRPDMAPFLFADAITKGKTLKIFNNGNMQRDFTYIEDTIDGLSAVVNAEMGNSYTIFNIGNSKPVMLMDFVKSLESALGKTADKEFLDMQPGDVFSTWADIKELVAAVGYSPKTSIDEGVTRFTEWYKHYYHTGY
ncbi:MAG TPA: NAD-dependent epimerase/dehydratase family protein [Sphingobacteriaceae bacterium]